MRILCLLFFLLLTLSTMAQKTQKPPLHARNWMAITGKPLSANAGAMIFTQGGNAIDAACAMLAAGCTMWDVLSWGGETQAIIYNPKTKKVISINALGVAPTGATVDFFKGKGYDYPPEYGPLAAVTPGTPGGLCFMLAEYGTMSLKQVLTPAMQMADGYPMEDETARSIERNKERIKQWPYSKAVFLPHAGQQYEAPEAGELFRQQDLLKINYKGIDVYKLQQWSQGPAMLQALNILENFDLKGMGYNSTRYIHTIYQSMSLAFADRDFYYGDPYFSPDEPIQGLLSKDYAKDRAKLINRDKNDPKIGPGDPYPYEGKTNPYRDVMKQRGFVAYNNSPIDENYLDALHRGTTSIEAADKDGWVVSVTPSGGWVPACIAGRTGVGMSQRMQSFVLDPSIDPFNVVEPGKRPRVTLTPSLAMKDGKPFLAFAVQGGDTQDQNLLQFFLNMVEFGMTVQQATEAANINTNQLWLSLGGSKIEDRQPRPGEILLANSTPDSVRN